MQTKDRRSSSFFQEAKDKTVFVHLYDGSLFFQKYLKYVKKILYNSALKNFVLRKQFERSRSVFLIDLKSLEPSYKTALDIDLDPTYRTDPGSKIVLEGTPSYN